MRILGFMRWVPLWDLRCLLRRDLVENFCFLWGDIVYGVYGLSTSKKLIRFIRRAPIWALWGLWSLMNLMGLMRREPLWCEMGLWREHLLVECSCMRFSGFRRQAALKGLWLSRPNPPHEQITFMRKSTFMIFTGLMRKAPVTPQILKPRG